MIPGFGARLGAGFDDRLDGRVGFRPALTRPPADGQGPSLPTGLPPRPPAASTSCRATGLYALGLRRARLVWSVLAAGCSPARSRRPARSSATWSGDRSGALRAAPVWQDGGARMKSPRLEALRRARRRSSASPPPRTSPVSATGSSTATPGGCTGRANSSASSSAGSARRAWTSTRRSGGLESTDRTRDLLTGSDRLAADAAPWQEVLLPSGEERRHFTVIVPVADETGRVFRLYGTVQDITERRRLESGSAWNISERA